MTSVTSCSCHFWLVSTTAQLEESMQMIIERVWHEVRVSKLEKRLAAERILRDTLPLGSLLQQLAERNVADMEGKLLRMHTEEPRAVKQAS